jgi:hypothetical protein
MEDSSRTLIGPTARARTMSKSPFPDHGQRTTRQLIEGYLERKAHATGDLKAYSPGYYSITPIGYLHGYKSHDDFCKCLSPELSLYLPDCTVGAVDGANFTVTGNDVSGPKTAGKALVTYELDFRAHTPADAEEWWSITHSAAGGNMTEKPPPPEPSSPVDNKNSSRSHPQQPSVQAQHVAPTTAELKRAASFSSPVCYECSKYD